MIIPTIVKLSFLKTCHPSHAIQRHAGIELWGIFSSFNAKLISCSSQFWFPVKNCDLSLIFNYKMIQLCWQQWQVGMDINTRSHGRTLSIKLSLVLIKLTKSLLEHKRAARASTDLFHLKFLNCWLMKVFNELFCWEKTVVCSFIIKVSLQTKTMKIRELTSVFYFFHKKLEN